MISAAKLINSEILTDVFGVSKVFETARRLRELELFPMGRTEVSYRQAAMLLYCLAASRAVPDVIHTVERLPKIKDGYGNSFVHDFAEMLKDPQLFTAIDEISISQNTGLVAVQISDGSGGVQIGNCYRAKGTREPIVNHFCTLKAIYLVSFAATIKLQNLNFINN